MQIPDVGLEVEGNGSPAALRDEVLALLEITESAREPVIHEPEGEESEAVDIPFLKLPIAPGTTAREQLLGCGIDCRLPEIDVMNLADEARSEIQNDG